MDFRDGVIAHGKEFYKKVLSDPEDITNIEGIMDDFISDSDIRNAAVEGYCRKKGIDLPNSEDFPMEEGPDKLYGKKWDGKDLKKLYPKLWKKFKN